MVERERKGREERRRKFDGVWSHMWRNSTFGIARICLSTIGSIGRRLSERVYNNIETRLYHHDIIFIEQSLNQLLSRHPVSGDKESRREGLGHLDTLLIKCQVRSYPYQILAFARINYKYSTDYYRARRIVAENDSTSKGSLLLILTNKELTLLVFLPFSWYLWFLWVSSTSVEDLRLFLFTRSEMGRSVLQNLLTI